MPGPFDEVRSPEWRISRNPEVRQSPNSWNLFAAGRAGAAQRRPKLCNLSLRQKRLTVPVVHLCSPCHAW